MREHLSIAIAAVALIVAAALPNNSYGQTEPRQNFPALRYEEQAPKPIKWQAKHHPTIHRYPVKVRPVVPLYLPPSPVVIPPQPEAHGLGVEVTAAFLRTNLSFGEAWVGATNRTSPELSILAVRGPIRGRYTWTAGWSYKESFTPNLEFRVGETVFVTSAQAMEAQRTVDLNWRMADSHRIELSGSSGMLRPAFIGKWTAITMDASIDREGRQVFDSQTWRQFLWGAGGIVAVAYPNGTAVEICGVAGAKYSRAGAMVVWKLSDTTLGHIGWSWEEQRIGDLKARVYGSELGATVEW